MVVFLFHGSFQSYRRILFAGTISFPFPSLDDVLVCKRKILFCSPSVSFRSSSFLAQSSFYSSYKFSFDQIPDYVYFLFFIVVFCVIICFTQPSHLLFVIFILFVHFPRIVTMSQPPRPPTTPGAPLPPPQQDFGKSTKILQFFLFYFLHRWGI